MNFPRHHRRGRIEGSQVCHESFDYFAIFHGITAVAELKGPPGTQASDGRQIFHGITAVAELKARHELRADDRLAAFSTASPPWPN